MSRTSRATPISRARWRSLRTAVPISAALAAAAAVVLSGCGASAGTRMPPLKDVPLPPGAHVVSAIRSCDRGNNPYCAQQLVVVGPKYADSGSLLETEHRLLKLRGWTPDHGDANKQSAAESPGSELRLTYATAEYDLIGVDLGWIHRRKQITNALSDVMFKRLPAISLMLEPGAS